MKKIAWSWSRLDSFERCPQSFFQVTIQKRYPFQSSPAMERGKNIHNHIENALKGAEIHKDIEHMAPLINKLRGIKWDHMDSELEMAIMEDYLPTTWFSKNVWCRIKMDYTGVVGDQAITYDWKTGGNYGYTDQLKLYAGAVMLRYPEVATVETAYIYVDKEEKSTKTFYRAQYNEIWDEMADRAEQITIANESGDWPAIPSRFGCKFCPVENCPKRMR